jgi:hypothetical protein
MKKVGEGIGLVRPDYLSFKASLNPRRLEFGPILQALFTPRCFFIKTILENRKLLLLLESFPTDMPQHFGPNPFLHI